MEDAQTSVSKVVPTSEPAPPKKIRFWTGAEIKAEAPKQIDWIVRPWVARGAITEIDGKLKASGKTTFLVHMAAAAIKGLPFLGEPTRETSVVYLTEQPMDTFRVALEEGGLLGNPNLHVVFWHETLGVSWGRIVKAARAKCREVRAKLLIVDTLPQFTGMPGDGENYAGDALKAMRPLQEAAYRQRRAVVVSRHERKSGGEVGDSGRGSSAFSGVVDVILSIRRPEGKTRSTLREIRSLSRFRETPPVLMVELTKRGYISHGSKSAVATHEAKKAILAAAPGKEKNALTREELLDKAEVKSTTGRRVLDKLIKKGRLIQKGAGKKNDPYRYWASIEA